LAAATATEVNPWVEGDSLKPQSEVMKYFDYRIAIIQVQAGESNDEAWQRHLTKTPKDMNATIRVFNT
jgi:hypothetical protein